MYKYNTIRKTRHPLQLILLFLSMLISRWTKWPLPSTINLSYRNFRMRIGQNTLHFKCRNHYICLNVESKCCRSSLSQISNSCTCKKNWRQLTISRKAQTKCKIVKKRNHVFKHKIKEKVNERHRRSVTKALLPTLLCVLKKANENSISL